MELERSHTEVISLDQLFSLIDGNIIDPVKDGLFYSRSWFNVIEKTYGFKINAAIHSITNNYLIFALVENNLGKKLISLPFSDYIDYEKVDSDSEAEILTYLEKCYPNYSLLIKTNQEVNKIKWGRPIKVAVYHKILLNPDSNTTNIHSNSFIRGVKKAKKNGLKIEMSHSLSSLEEFYEMNATYRIQKFNKVPQPYGFFKNIYNEFISKRNGFVMKAKYNERTIASALILSHCNNLYYKFGCSNPEFLKLRPNNLIFSELTNYAIENRFNTVDLGLSGIGDEYEGLRRFKESMGGTSYNITYLGKNSEYYPNKSTENFNLFIDHLIEEILRSQDSKKIKKLSSVVYPYFV